jgi:hypothetical protein
MDPTVIQRKLSQMLHASECAQDMKPICPIIEDYRMLESNIFQCRRVCHQEMKQPFAQPGICTDKI